jgi:hypothetical protein
MPIETLYGVSCDECEELLFEGEFHAWAVRSEALAAATREGWTTEDEHGERLLCPSCAVEDGGE